MRYLFTLGIAMTVLALPRDTEGAIIVDLNPALAVHDSSVDTPAYGNIVVPAPTSSAGLTFNVTFTPDAADVAGTDGIRNLIEIGGSANGTGLYLQNGQIVFIGKANGDATFSPSASNDLDLTGASGSIRITSGFGTLVAGTEYSLAAVYEPATAKRVTLALLPTFGSLEVESYVLTNDGTHTNWHGNNSFTALNTAPFTGTGIGGAGGALGLNTNGVWKEADIVGLTGTPGRALYWNLQGNIVPEPASVTLLPSAGC